MKRMLLGFLVVGLWSCYYPSKANVAQKEAEVAATGQEVARLKAEKAVCHARVEKFMASGDTLQARKESCFEQDASMANLEKQLRDDTIELEQYKRDCSDCDER